MPKVSIIILNWNGKKDTLECLESLSKVKIKGFKLKIIVVDNGSTDDSLKVIRAKCHPALDAGSTQLIENPINLGFSEGNNVGIAEALKQKSDYILLLNNDTDVDKNFIVEFVKVAKKHPEAAIFSPKIYFAKGYEFHKDRYKKEELGKVIWCAGGSMDWDNVFGINVGVDEVDTGQYDKVRRIAFATGACILIDAKALKKVGSFDKRYFTYFEDTDLSQRFLKNGYKIFYVPKSIIYHKVAQSSGIGSNLNDYFITRNRMLFGMKYAPLRTKIALFRESIRFLLFGRKWQKTGIRDYYIGKFGKGSWQ